MRPHKLLPGFIVILVFTTSAAGEETDKSLTDKGVDQRIALIQAGTSHATIVIAHDAPDTVRRAGERLRQYIKQMTDVDLPLVTDQVAIQSPAHRSQLQICVGPSELTRSEVAELSADPYAPGGQDAIVRHIDDKIILTGSGALNGIATRYAVGKFLHVLGARCYRGVPREAQDDPLYMVMPRTKELTITANLDIPVKSIFLARTPNSTLSPIWSSGGGVSWEIAHNWHGVLQASEFESHPEYFIMRDGNRQQGRPCESHPQIIARFASTAANAFAQGRQSFSLTPPDGTRGLCDCQRCQQAYKNPKKTADRFLIFANAVRRELDREYPHYQDHQLHILAGYGWPENLIPPSAGVVSDRGVTLWVAHQGCHAHGWDDLTCPINREWAKHLRGWMNASPQPVGIYEYSCYSNYRWDRKWASFPVVSVRRVVQDVAAYHRVGVGYVYYEAEAGWHRYVPFRWINAYAIERAMANPDLDPDALLKTLCDDLYGHAAQSMQAYYELLQRRLEETSLHRGGWYLPDPAKVYSEADVKNLTDLVNHAVWQAQETGGKDLQRCLEAQKVWFEAVVSLTDPDRDENGPKRFREAPW